MPHVIDIEECTACAACEAECPTGAITMHESEEYYLVDASACTDCGDCVEVCPVEAITAVEPPSL